ncbi:MAG: single-stranded-DNA-specific exonuclease [Chthoniobacter sp.]|jgi:single-stranded-DNA-specific exonuclease|nr:single-stranded-DNA-specific exonuclease [Chthoniobacter sp.]
MSTLQQGSSLNDLRWIVAGSGDAAAEAALSQGLSLAPFLVSLLCRRGFGCSEDAHRFLHPRLKLLSDPFLLPNMRAAVQRILRGVDRNERIVLYGDYDVDGVTSLALFTRVLRAFGASPDTFLPLRMDEGYGLSRDGVTRCLSTCKPQLLIAVDCGTCSVEEIALLRQHGVDTLVFDHHECQGAQPDCVALVNPKLGDDFHYLCSVGIVFKACHALLKERPLEDFDLREYLDLVALGTVADIVPLVRENRILVQRGLLQLARSRWPGVRALMDAASVKPPLSPGDIGFKLGPRINAAGRLDSAAEALELLLTDDPARAHELAARLDTQNRARQDVEKAIVKQAEEKLLSEFDCHDHAAIVLGEDGWHPGVLGIAASRIAKANHRPTIVIGFDESGAGKGSGRSIDGLSLVKTLGDCAHLLDKFGGHEMAAGLAIQRARFSEFREAFLRCARAKLTDEQLQPRLHLDAELALAHLDFDFLAHHDLLQPFGMGNPQPVFYARRVFANDSRVVGEKHLRLLLRQSGRAHPAIFFNAAQLELPPPPWDVAFQIGRNEWEGRVSVQLELKALRSAES